MIKRETSLSPPLLTVADLEEKLAAEFPQAFGPGRPLSIVSVEHGGAVLRLERSDDLLRPGGTLSGAALMMLADDAMYVALLASVGWKPLAVTTSLTINFLRKPAPGPLTGTCRILKLGRRLVVGEVAVRALGHNDIVAHATCTYSLPDV